MNMTHPSRKRLRAAAKQLMDVDVGDFVRLRGQRGVARVGQVINGWARVMWMSGDKEGEATEHPLASLRKAVRIGGHDLDARKP